MKFTMLPPNERWTMRPSQILLLLPLVVACNTDPTGARPVPIPPRLNFMNGPAELPNLVRFNGIQVLAIGDAKTDLAVFAGLPENVKQATACIGGTDDSWGIGDFQFAGIRQQVIKAVVSNTDATLNVYRLSTFEGFCVSDPIATGRGTLRYHDNDVFLTSGRRDTFGFEISGPVTLAMGGTANLDAHTLLYTLPDGTFGQEVSQVKLSGN
jgi:hypothetical protein